MVLGVFHSPLPWNFSLRALSKVLRRWCSLPLARTLFNINGLSALLFLLALFLATPAIDLYRRNDTNQN
jgi:hypothetical protein